MKRPNTLTTIYGPCRRDQEFVLKDSLASLLNILLKQRHLSLGGKFAFSIALILSIIMGVVGNINYKSQKELFLENLHSKGITLGQLIAAVSPESILSGDAKTLDKYIRYTSHEHDVVYVVIRDEKKSYLTSYLNETNNLIANAISTLGTSNLKHVIGFILANDDILHLQMPIHKNDRFLGYVLIGLSQDRVLSQIQFEFINQLISNLFIIMFLSMCIYWAFRNHALRPVQELYRAAKRVSNGDLDRKVRVYSYDELGKLSSSFNEMMINLKSSTAEKEQALQQLQELNKTLESRVMERTLALEAVNKQLKHIALHDPLTGLANRTLIKDRLEQAIRIAKREQKPLAIIMMDLDRFKEINDTLGHNVGDQLLQEVAKRLLGLMREMDTVGRLGGDEFALIIPGSDEENALHIASTLVDVLDKPVVLGETSFSIEASLGITVYPQHGLNSTTLLKRADVAMYVAKRNRKGFFLYATEVDQHTPARLALISDVRKAVERNEFELYYQPRIDLATGDVIGVEALSRWLHTARGFVPPDEFVPILVQTGLILPFTLWVLDTAMRQWKEWYQQGIELMMSVNLSMRNLQDPNLPDQVQALLDKWDVKRDYLILEVTESEIMSDPEHVMKTMEKLENMGTLLSIDDFGTGYSSLSYLKKLPVHELKIDRSFIKDMVTDKDDKIIVRSTIELAHNLGLEVTAEGIETRDVLDMLIDFKCDLAQGFYFGKPMPAEQLLDTLGKRTNNNPTVKTKIARS